MQRHIPELSMGVPAAMGDLSVLLIIAPGPRPSLTDASKLSGRSEAHKIPREVGQGGQSQSRCRGSGTQDSPLKKCGTPLLIQGGDTVHVPHPAPAD